MVRVRIHPGRPAGTVHIPASKSLAHRAVICAALSGGTSHLTNLTPSNDIAATLGGMAQLGAVTEHLAADDIIIHGAGAPNAAAHTANDNSDDILTIDCGESGSTLRFFIPIFSLTGRRVRFICHGRLAARPQTVYQEIFARLGVDFHPFADEEAAGWELSGSLTPGEYTVRGDISSQFISGLLFALPLLGGSSVLKILPPFESRSYVELTLQTLAEFGIAAHWQDDFTLAIPGNQHYTATDHAIEGDFSQLAFFAVLGAINSEITVSGLNHASAQGDKKIVDIVRQMGGTVTETPDGYIFAPGKLTAADIDLADCPDLGPVLTVLAACAHGDTCLFNAGRLRIKESDRIADVECELQRFGIATHSTADELTVSGTKIATADSCCHAHNDHRIVMALAVLATVAAAPVDIAQAEAVNKSYPRFFEDLQNLGIKVEFFDD